MSTNQPDGISEIVRQITINCSLACLSVRKFSDTDLASAVGGQLPPCKLCGRPFLPHKDELYCGDCLNNMG